MGPLEDGRVDGSTQGQRGVPAKAGAHGPDADAPLPEDPIARLSELLGAAGELPLDRRLELLRSTESEIARALEGLDGL